MTRAMLGPGAPADDLALAMKERKQLSSSPCAAPAWPPPYPRTQERDVTAELNMIRAAKCIGNSCSQSNLALAFPSIIGGPNRVRTQRAARAARWADAWLGSIGWQ